MWGVEQQEKSPEATRGPDRTAQARGKATRHSPTFGPVHSPLCHSDGTGERDAFLDAGSPTRPAATGEEICAPVRAADEAVVTTASSPRNRPWRTLAIPLAVVLLVAIVFVSARDPEAALLKQEFPPFPDCPYVVPTGAEALARGHDPDIPGNVLWVEEIRFGRLGNRFLGLTNILQLGFCCKSKLVSLPPKSEILAPGFFNEGVPGPRWFDFSSAPDTEGFDPNTCPAEITWAGGDALYLTGLDDEEHPNYTPGLRECILSGQRLVGCEAAHYFPMDMDLCGSNQTRQANETADTGGPSAAKPPGNETLEDQEQGTEMDRELGNGTAGGGNLVIHVRSGDIFVPPAHRAYGQPPFQWYLRVLEDRQWDRVDVVTNGFTDSTHRINPVVPALEAMVANGELTGDIRFHKDRGMDEDLAAMLCADGLVTAHSSLAKSWTYHAAATRIYFPFSCHGFLYDLEDLRPGVKVYGMQPTQEDYSPYHGWDVTEEQLAGMFAFNVTGLEECKATSDSGEE